MHRVTLGAAVLGIIGVIKGQPVDEVSISVFSGIFPLDGRYSIHQVFGPLSILNTIFGLTNRFGIGFFPSINSINRVVIKSKTVESKIRAYGFLSVSIGGDVWYRFPAGRLWTYLRVGGIWTYPFSPQVDRADVSDYLYRKLSSPPPMLEVSSVNAKFKGFWAPIFGLRLEYYLGEGAFGAEGNVYLLLEGQYIHGTGPVKISGTFAHISGGQKIYENFDTGADVYLDWRVIIIEIGGGVNLSK